VYDGRLWGRCQIIIALNHIGEVVDTAKKHRFLDEAGDTTFYGKGRLPIIGNDGVSNCFILGMLKINEPLPLVRARILALQAHIASDAYFLNVPSIVKKSRKNGYFLHAKDDLPEVRKMFFDMIRSIDCSFEAVVARKVPLLYERKHNGREAEMYADLLSHLLKDKLSGHEHLVMNISHRGKCTTNANLQKGLDKGVGRAKRYAPTSDNGCKVVFNVQSPLTEPLLNISDYFCWALQRVFERGEVRFYEALCDKIALVHDLYDESGDGSGGNLYRRNGKKLTEANCLVRK